MYEQKIAAVARDAESEFWKFVTSQFPEAKSNVFLGEWANEFSAACRNAVRHWVVLNIREEDAAPPPELPEH
jgi:hypothetical protein